MHCLTFFKISLRKSYFFKIAQWSKKFSLIFLTKSGSKYVNSDKLDEN